jgi:hypothetical protein
VRLVVGEKNQLQVGLAGAADRAQVASAAGKKGLVSTYSVAWQAMRSSLFSQQDGTVSRSELCIMSIGCTSECHRWMR